MPEGLKSLGLDAAIRLRWVLRDIKARRLKLSPPDPADLQKLIEMGYVEMQGDEPVMTSKGDPTVGIERARLPHASRRIVVDLLSPAYPALTEYDKAWKGIIPQGLEVVTAFQSEMWSG